MMMALPTIAVSTPQQPPTPAWKVGALPFMPSAPSSNPIVPSPALSDVYQPVSMVTTPSPSAKSTNKKSNKPLTLTEKAGIASLAVAGLGLAVYGVTANQTALFKYLPENITNGTKQFFSNIWAALDKKAETVTPIAFPTAIIDKPEELAVELLAQVQTYTHELAALGYQTHSHQVQALQNDIIVSFANGSIRLEQVQHVKQQLNTILQPVTPDLAQYGGIISAIQQVERLTKFSVEQQMPEQIGKTKAEAETLIAKLTDKLVCIQTLPAEQKADYYPEVETLYTQLKEKQRALELLHLYTAVRNNPKASADYLEMLEAQFPQPVLHDTLRATLQQFLNQENSIISSGILNQSFYNSLTKLAANNNLTPEDKAALALALHKIARLAVHPPSHQHVQGGIQHILEELSGKSATLKTLLESSTAA
jgi:hypothetical protein